MRTVSASEGSNWISVIASKVVRTYAHAYSTGYNSGSAFGMRFEHLQLALQGLRGIDEHERERLR